MDLVLAGNYWGEFYLVCCVVAMLRVGWFGRWPERFAATFLLMEWCIKNYYHDYVGYSPMVNSLSGIFLVLLTYVAYHQSHFNSRALYYLCVLGMGGVLICGVHVLIDIPWHLTLSLNVVFFGKISAVIVLARTTEELNGEVQERV